MDTVLIDTSVWVNYFKEDIETLATKYLDNQLDNIVITTCPVIIQEVLQGVITDKDFRQLKSYFDKLLQLVNDPYELALEAAQLYRSLRKKGITIRKPNDCLIAVYAINHDAYILHEDKDFVNIAKNSDLKLINP